MENSLYTIGRLAHYSIISIAIVIALTSLGINFRNVALIAGALSVGIGFGLQTIVSNFLSGIIILFDRSLKIGDFLELESGFRGRVTEINVRTTVIRTNDGVDVVVPNSEIVGNRLINWTMQDLHRRIRVPFSVAYGTDKELVKKAALEAADKVPRTLQGVGSYRQPQVWLVAFGESALEFELVVWLNAYASKRYSSTKAAYLWEIESALRRYNIEIPFPQRVVHVRDSNPLRTEIVLPDED